MTVSDTHSYLHRDSSHPRHCKESLQHSQFLRLRSLCSDNADFYNQAHEMASFFERRGYNPQTLQQDLEKIKHPIPDRRPEKEHLNGGKGEQDSPGSHIPPSEQQNQAYPARQLQGSHCRPCDYSHFPSAADGRVSPG